MRGFFNCNPATAETALIYFNGPGSHPRSLYRFSYGLVNRFISTHQSVLLSCILLAYVNRRKHGAIWCPQSVQDMYRTNATKEVNLRHKVKSGDKI